MLADSLLACPVDLRQHAARRVVVCGGLSPVPGFAERLVAGGVEILSRRGFANLAAEIAVPEISNETAEISKSRGRSHAAWLGVSVARGLEDVYARHNLSVAREDDWDAGVGEREESAGVQEIVE